MNRIRQLRKEKNITQVRLSIELEVSQETISAYEKEKHFPSTQFSDPAPGYLRCFHRLYSRTFRRPV